MKNDTIRTRQLRAPLGLAKAPAGPVDLREISPRSRSFNALYAASNVVTAWDSSR